MSSDSPWFTSHANGFFWKPVTWQGWIVVIAYYAVLLAILAVTLYQPHTTKKLLTNLSGSWAAATFVLYGVIFRFSHGALERRAQS